MVYVCVCVVTIWVACGKCGGRGDRVVGVVITERTNWVCGGRMVDMMSPGKSLTPTRGRERECGRRDITGNIFFFSLQDATQDQ